MQLVLTEFCMRYQFDQYYNLAAYDNLVSVSSQTGWNLILDLVMKLNKLKQGARLDLSQDLLFIEFN